jgi:hypothetical protein
MVDTSADVVTDAKFVGDPEINVKSRGGSWNFTDDDKRIYLVGGISGLGQKDPGKVRIFNLSKDKYLTFEKIKVKSFIPWPSAGDKEYSLESYKCNPGRNWDVGAPSQDAASALTNSGYHWEVGNLKWHTVDPLPGDKGGSSDADRQWDAIVDWFKQYWWVFAVLIALVVIMVIYYLFKVRSVG